MIKAELEVTSSAISCQQESAVRQNKQVAHVTLSQRQILFARMLFVTPNGHILKNITFD